MVERRQSAVPSFGKGERSSPHDALLDLCDLKQESRFCLKKQNKKTFFGNRHVDVKVSPIRIDLFGPRGDFDGFFKRDPLEWTW